MPYSTQSLFKNYKLLLVRNLTCNYSILKKIEESISWILLFACFSITFGLCALSFCQTYSTLLHLSESRYEYTQYILIVYTYRVNLMIFEVAFARKAFRTEWTKTSVKQVFGHKNYTLLSIIRMTFRFVEVFWRMLGQ